MKELCILVGVNGWEYSVAVKINYVSSYELVASSDATDSEGKPSPNKIILDGKTEVDFLRRGIEVLTKSE